MCNMTDAILGAADMGYGYTKIWANGKHFRQPAVVGEPRRIRNEDINKDDVRYYEGSEDLLTVKYFLGDLAIRHSPIRYTSTGQDRAKAWITRVLLEAGLAATAGSAAINLVTGLPVDYYFKQKADFEEMLKGFNDGAGLAVSTGRSGPKGVVRPMINDFHVVPQPLGAFMHHHLNDQGELIDAAAAKKRWRVLDFGFGTFDDLEMEDLQIMPGSGSPVGVAISNAYRLIQEELKDQLGHTPDTYTLDRYILNGLPFDGYDLSKLKDWAFNAIAAQAQNEIDSVNRIPDGGTIITGGWAQEMASRLNLGNNVVIMDQLGNLNGYRKIGRRRWYRRQS